MENFSEIAYQFFVRYPKLQEIFFTIDATAFPQFHYAHEHAKGLKDKQIVKFTRDQFDKQPLISEDDRKLDAEKGDKKTKKEK